jgi:hypothetical protein
MDQSILGGIRGVNAKLRTLLQATRDALGGRQNFSVEDVRAIAAPVAQMQPIVEEATRRITIQPEVGDELQAYAGNLAELQVVLQQMRIMLLTRRANLEALRGHLQTVGLWAEALRQTQL